MTNTRFRYIVLALGLIPFCYWVMRHIGTDLWYDESYSFVNFVTSGFIKGSLLSYPLPNNHVFLNFLGQILALLVQVKNGNDAAQYIYLFRAFQGLIALTTAFYSMKLVKEVFKLEFSVLAFALLFTCIPFMNFSLQWRGYNLSGLFLIALFYYLFTWLETGTKKQRNRMIAAAALLLYTIPSNSYMLVSLMGVCLVYFGWNYFFQEKTAAKKYWKAFQLLLLGFVFAVVLYLPILKNVLFNDYSVKATNDVFFSLKLLPELAQAFLAKRYVLLLLAAIGIGFLFKHRENTVKFLFLLLAFIGPFVLSFLHQKLPFDRVFVPLSPLFSLLLLIPILQLIQHLSYQFLKWGLLTLIPLYAFYVFQHEVKNNELEIRTQLVQHNRIQQTVTQNYYLSSVYNPNACFSYIKSLGKVDTIFEYQQIDYPSLEIYLNMQRLNYGYLNNAVELKRKIESREFTYLSTTYPDSLLQYLAPIEAIKVQVLSNKHPITTVVQVENTKK